MPELIVNANSRLACVLGPVNSPTLSHLMLQLEERASNSKGTSLPKTSLTQALETVLLCREFCPGTTWARIPQEIFDQIEALVLSVRTKANGTVDVEAQTLDKKLGITRINSLLAPYCLTLANDEEATQFYCSLGGVISYRITTSQSLLSCDMTWSNAGLEEPVNSSTEHSEPFHETIRARNLIERFQRIFSCNGILSISLIGQLAPPFLRASGFLAGDEGLDFDVDEDDFAPVPWFGRDLAWAQPFGEDLDNYDDSNDDDDDDEDEDEDDEPWIQDLNYLENDEREDTDSIDDSRGNSEGEARSESVPNSDSHGQASESPYDEDADYDSRDDTFSDESHGRWF